MRQGTYLEWLPRDLRWFLLMQESPIHQAKLGRWFPEVANEAMCQRDYAIHWQGKLRLLDAAALRKKEEVEEQLGWHNQLSSVVAAYEAGDEATANWLTVTWPYLNLKENLIDQVDSSAWYYPHFLETLLRNNIATHVQLFEWGDSVKVCSLYPHEDYHGAYLSSLYRDDLISFQRYFNTPFLCDWVVMLRKAFKRRATKIIQFLFERVNYVLSAKQAYSVTEAADFDDLKILSPYIQAHSAYICQRATDQHQIEVLAKLANQSEFLSELRENLDAMTLLCDHEDHFYGLFYDIQEVIHRAIEDQRYDLAVNSARKYNWPQHLTARLSIELMGYPNYSVVAGLYSRGVTCHLLNDDSLRSLYQWGLRNSDYPLIGRIIANHGTQFLTPPDQGSDYSSNYDSDD